MALAWLGVWFSAPNGVQAHSSGPPRLADAAAGPYRVFVWTQPEPLRVGDTHISILVTLATTNQPVNDVQVKVHFTAQTDPGKGIVVVTSPQEFLSNRYHEADVQLPSAGIWYGTIDITGPAGEGNVHFNGEVLPARTLNWWLIGGAAVALTLLLGLIGVWSRLQTRPQPAAPMRVAHSARVAREIRVESK